MKEFFQFVYGGQSGLACITRVDMDGNPTRDKFFEYPAQLDEMVTYCTRFSHESIYFCPTLMSENKRRKSSVKVAEVAFADADTCPVDSLRAQPSLIAQTSPTKTHVYWKFTDETDPKELERRSHAVSKAHLKKETDLDDGWASNKLLRVPGTTHLKDPQNPFKVTYEITGVVYTTEQFDALYPVAELLHVEQTALPENIPSREDALSMVKWTQEIQDIITGDYQKDSGRFRALHLAQHEIFRAGGSNEVAFALLVDSNLNKWAADKVSDSSQRLWEDIQRARAQSELVGPDEAAPLAVTAPKEDRYKRVDFLTAEERASIKPTFVDEFVAWGQSRTKTSPVFHVAAGFSVLSTVFSDFAHIDLRFGREPLNLWYMPTGASTVDRKTTVLNQMLRMLRDLGREGVYDYSIGSDFTVSGLSDQLLDSPNRSGIVHIDEFQGFLEELGKNYMAGTKGALTAMYGGQIKGKLRATATTKRKPEVAFALNFYAMGITKQVAEALDRDDFLSGFLTRFIYVSPPDDYVPPNVTDGFELAPRNEAKNGDKEYEALVDKVRTARGLCEHWLDPEAATQPIDITQEAHERMKQFMEDMAGAVRAQGKEELVSTTLRLSISVYKCAALLAMVEGKDTVTVNYVLAAINYAHDWYLNILRMVDLISESDWVKIQDDIIAELIAGGSSMDSRKLYGKFKDQHKPREYAEFLKALVDAGEIQQVTEGKKVMINYVGGDID